MNASQFQCLVPPAQAAMFNLVRCTTNTVYVLALNHPSWLEQLGPALLEAPYKAAPKAPVLIIKHPASFAPAETDLLLPESMASADLLVSVALTVARETYRIRPDQAGQHVSAMGVGVELVAPIQDAEAWYRPGLARRAVDGLAVQGVPTSGARMPQQVDTFINGALRHSLNPAEMIRGAAQALAEVSELMSLHPGDQLWLGAAAGGPAVFPGDHVRVVADGLHGLEFGLAALRDEEQS